MRIVVTGGAGYTGSELVTQLAINEEIEEIIVYDNLSRGNYNLFLDYAFQNHGIVKLIPGDILDTRKLVKVLDGVDVVYHLAANVTTPFADSDPHFYEQVNNWGTSEIAYLAKEAKVKKFIYTSSTSVYGVGDFLYDESSETNPVTFYGVSKLRGEEHLEALLDKMQVYVIRCGNIYGYSRSMRFDAVINRFAFESNFFNRIVIEGDGNQTRSFVHIDTVTNILSKLAALVIPSGKYNLVDSNYRIIDIADSLKKVKPGLEQEFVEKQIVLKSINVNTDLKLGQYLNIPQSRPLTQQLQIFLDHFSF